MASSWQPRRCGPLALEPGKTGRFPASDGTAMPLIVERTFETAGNIVTGAVSRRRHGAPVTVEGSVPQSAYRRSQRGLNC
jgi:hypothetical protein